MRKITAINRIKNTTETIVLSTNFRAITDTIKITNRLTIYTIIPFPVSSMADVRNESRVALIIGRSSSHPKTATIWGYSSS